MEQSNYYLQNHQCALLVIDIQESLFNSMDYDVRLKVMKNAGVLVETARRFEIPMVVTEQYRKGLGKTIKEVMEKIGDVEIFDKMYFDCMKDTAIKDKIHDINRGTYIITGIETHICVLQTALSLLAEGKNVVVASDAVCSRSKHEWKMAVAALRQAGAIVYPTESIAFMLMGKAGTPVFKELSPLFK